MRVLAYHRVEPLRDLAWNRVSPARLRAQMRLLARRGYRVVPLRELMEGGDPRAVAATFDDGLADALRYAVPVLAELGFAGTVFVPTAWIGKRTAWDVRLAGRAVRHATWEELSLAAAAGWEIGSHGHTHRDLATLGAGELHGELETSRARIKGRIGTGPRSIAYPFGSVSETVAAAAREAGFSWGCLSVPTRGPGDPLRLGRVGVRVFDTDPEFLSKVTEGALYPLQVAKDRVAHFFAMGTPRIWHRLRKVKATC